MKEIPEIYKQYPFFDDGKYSPSRFHIATVVKIMTPDEAKKHTIFLLRESDPDNPECCKTAKLYDIWKETVEDCKSDCVYPHDENGYWCYAPETDCFVVCAIPEYDDSLIFFARHINGGWFSFETTGSWQCGLLDIDCDKFSGYKEDFPEVYEKYKDLFKYDKSTEN